MFVLAWADIFDRKPLLIRNLDIKLHLFRQVPLKFGKWRYPNIIFMEEFQHKNCIVCLMSLSYYLGKYC